MFLAHTRLDLAYALSVVSQYMHNPGEQHMNQCFQNRNGDRTGKVTGSRFTGRTGSRTAIELVMS